MFMPLYEPCQNQPSNMQRNTHISNHKGRRQPFGIAKKEQDLKSGLRGWNPGLFLISYVTSGKSFNLTGPLFSHL